MGTLVKTNRKTAIAQGDLYYLSTKPCRRGHIAPRLVSNYSCSVCATEKSKLWQSKNREKLKEKTKHYHLKSKFNISYQDYLKLTEEQQNKCAICLNEETSQSNGGAVKRLAVDHDHTTGQIRGLLCNNCNRAIGLLKDSPIILESAKQYLLSNSKS